MSCRSNSTASQQSDRSKSNGSNHSKPADCNSKSPMLINNSSVSGVRTGSASTAVDSQYLWTRGSSPRPAEQRRSWNFSSSPPSSVIEAVDSRTYLEPQENNKQFYTFKPERSPHHVNSHHQQQSRRYGDNHQQKKIRLSDGYHSDA